MTNSPVHRIEIPNLFFEGDNNVYVIACDPVTLIDAGTDTDDAYERLRHGLKSAGLAMGDIKRVILTHKHADHVGLVARIADECDARIYIHEADWGGIAQRAKRHAEYGALVKRRLEEWGTPSEEIEPLMGLLSKEGKPVRSVPAEKLRDGDLLPLQGGHLEIIHTPGHTMGSICLRWGSYLFTGDHVLPKTSPNIGAGDLRNENLLAYFLDSLERVAAFEIDGLRVEPGHGAPFSDLKSRCRELTNHHRRRLDKTLDVLSDGQPKTAFHVAGGLFRKLRGFHVFLGVAEAYAHLEYLRQDGKVTLSGNEYQIA